MQQGFFESDDNYANRVKREAASRLGLSQGFFESDEKYMRCVDISVKYAINNGMFNQDPAFRHEVDLAIGRSLGLRQRPFESDDSYGQRIQREIGRSLNLSQGLWEDDDSYKTRIDLELGNRADIRPEFLELYNDYLRRLKRELVPKSTEGHPSNNPTSSTGNSQTATPYSYNLHTAATNKKEPLATSIICLIITIINQFIALYRPPAGILFGIVMLIVGCSLIKKLPTHRGLAIAILILSIVSILSGLLTAYITYQ